MSTDAMITAAQVKQLRDETDSPMLECKRALQNTNGDYDQALVLLRDSHPARRRPPVEDRLNTLSNRIANLEAEVSMLKTQLTLSQPNY